MGRIIQSIRSLLSFYFEYSQQKELLDNKIDYTKERIKKRLEVFAEKELKDQPELLELISSIEVVEGFAPDEILKMVNELD